MNKYFIVSALVMLLAACSSTEFEVYEAELFQFQRGTTTEQEVLAVLGEPQTVTKTYDGRRVLSYVHTQTDVDTANSIPVVKLVAGGAETTVTTLLITLSSEGIVEDWTKSDMTSRMEL